MIKKILLSFILVFFSLTATASDVKYYKIDNYQTLLKQLSQAERNDFPVFIYVQADWCYVCDYMERDIWSQKRVTSALNKNFLNLNIDITNMTKEKNEMLKYMDIKGTPAYFFYDKSGVLRHRQGGYMIAEEILEQVEKLK